MSSSATAINTLSRQLFIYGGFCLSVIGIIGACANIYLFTRRRYRQVPCCLFMLTGACFDLTVLLIALLFYRVMNQFLQYDIMTFNLFLCKLRLYLVSTCLPLSIWFACLSTFNRFCITSRNAVQRQWCTPKRCRIMAAMLILTFATYRSPDLYYVNIFSTNGVLSCVISPTAYTYVNLHTYFTFPVILTTLPLTVLIILAFRTRANLRLLTAQQTANRMEQQLTAMVLLQALGTSCLIPYTINIFYSTITKYDTKSAYQVAIENLITQIVTLGFYTYYSSAFYVYLIASPDIRRSVRAVWHKIRGKLGRNNHIVPTTVHLIRSRQVNVTA